MNRYTEQLARLAVGGKTVGLVLAPRVIEMPLALARYDDPFLPYCKAVISATRGHACAYVFDMGAFLALGGAGAVALERAIAYARAGGEALAVLHGPFASGSFAPAAADAAFAVDAVTLAPGVDGALFEQLGLGVYRIGDAAAAGEGAYLADELRGPLPGMSIPLVPEEEVRAARREDFEAVILAALLARAAR